MRKTLFAAVCCLALALSVSAQEQVVKDAEHSFKSAKDYPAYQAVIRNLTPAFTNPETANLPKTYFVPGKAGFDVYDQYYMAISLGREVDHAAAAHALMDGYGYFTKAFALDSVPDDRGRIKPKYSKDMINIIKGHVDDFDRSGVFLFQAGDYKGAYDAWDALLSINADPRFGLKSYPDSVITMIRINQSYAAINANDYEAALAALERAIDAGTDNVTVYENAARLAAQLQQNDKFKALARAGYEKFGASDPNFLEWTINTYIDSQDYETASRLLDEAIAANPDNAQYYYSLGVLRESQEKYDDAKAAYKKAVALDDQFSRAYMNLGRMLAEENDRLDASAGSMNEAQYDAFKNNTLFPILRESAQNFERAYALDAEANHLALRYLKNIYWVLQDHDNFNRVKALLDED